MNKRECMSGPFYGFFSVGANYEKGLQGEKGMGSIHFGDVPPSYITI